MNIQNAERKQARIKMALQGPSGSGKTYSSLLIALGLCNSWNKIVVIDTENQSSHLYAHLGDYKVLSISPPFSPERYIQAIKACVESGAEIIIIDSISHEWEGEGGILSIHGKMTGNSFTNWNAVTPRHNAFVNAIIQCPIHIVATIRSKQDYVLSEKNGKYVPEKVGLKGVTREGVDYEMTLVFELDIKHNAKSTKDRTGLFIDKPEILIDPAIGERIKAWCTSGTSKEQVKAKVQKCETVDQLNDLYKQYPEYSEDLLPEFRKRKTVLESKNESLTPTNQQNNGNSNFR